MESTRPKSKRRAEIPSPCLTRISHAPLRNAHRVSTFVGASRERQASLTRIRHSLQYRLVSKILVGFRFQKTRPGTSAPHCKRTSRPFCHCYRLAAVGVKIAASGTKESDENRASRLAE